MLLHYLGRILNARKYNSEVPDWPVGSAAVEHNCEPLSHNSLLENTKSPRFSLRALIAAPFRLLVQLRTLPRLQRTPPFHRFDRHKTRTCCSANCSPRKRETLPTRSGRPGRSRARYVTEQSSPSTGLDTQKKDRNCRHILGLRPIRLQRPRYCVAVAESETAHSTQRRERQAARDGGRKQGLVCCELQARHVNPNRGPWRVYATAPPVQGSSQISPAQYTAIPLE